MMNGQKIPPQIPDRSQSFTEIVVEADTTSTTNNDNIPSLNRTPSKKSQKSILKKNTSPSPTSSTFPASNTVHEDPFSWNDASASDNDVDIFEHDDTITATRCQNCFRWFGQFPFWLQQIMYILIGSLIFLFFGLIDYGITVTNNPALADDYPGLSSWGPGEFTIGSIPVFVLSIWGVISWSSFYGTRLILSVFPVIAVRVLGVIFGTVTKAMYRYISTIRLLAPSIVRTLWALISFLAWRGIFTKSFYTVNGIQDGSTWWTSYIGFFLYALTWTFFIFTLERWLIQWFAAKFHANAYRDRIADSKYAYKVLEALNNARNHKKPVSSANLHVDSGLTAPSPANGTSTATTSAATTPRPSHDEENTPTETNPMNEEAIHQIRQEIHRRKSLKAATRRNKLAAALEKTTAVAKDLASDVKDGFKNVVVGGPGNGLILLSTADARELARQLFYALRSEGPDNMDRLRLKDFEPWFGTPAEAVRAFDLFDQDSNGDISRKEFKLAVVSMFRERTSIELALQSSSQAIKKLDGILKGFASVICTFIFLSTFSIDYSGFLGAAVSIWLGLAFALSATVKTVVENLIFLFITHPYDVGDRVDIDVGERGNLERYTVVQFQLMVTVLKRVDGVTIFSPNSVLSTKSIRNIRRSGPQSEDILIPVELDTPTEKIKLLEEKINQFLARESRDYGPKITISWKDIISKSTLLLNVSLDYKSNWQDGPLKTARRNKFMQHLRQCLRECEIIIAAPTGLSVDLNLRKDGSQSVLGAGGMYETLSQSNETLISGDADSEGVLEQEEESGLRRRRHS